jgi:hypothetical protein
LISPPDPLPSTAGDTPNLNSNTNRDGTDESCVTFSITSSNDNCFHTSNLPWSSPLIARASDAGTSALTCQPDRPSSLGWPGAARSHTSNQPSPPPLITRPSDACTSALM